MQTLDPIQAPAAAPDDARNRLVIGILLFSAFVVILNETIMSVAIPRLMTDLGATASNAQWLTTAFLLTMAVVIPVTGFVLQRLNTRPVFMTAMACFSAGTLLAALSPGLGVLVLARAVQAVGTAIMMPLLMTTVMELVPENRRGKTMGEISTVISVAPALGPTISGLILTYLSWRWMFGLVLPISLGALLLGWRRIPNVSPPREAPLDLPSVALSIFAFGGLVYGLTQLGGAPPPPGMPSGPLALGVGAATMVAFVARQLWLQREERALLDLRTFRSPVFAVSVTMMGISMMALLGTIILLPIYMQSVLGLSTLTSGLLLLPGGLLMGLVSPFVGRWYDAHGPRRLVVPGTILVSAVLGGFALMGEHTAPGWVLAAHVTLCGALSLVFTPLFTASLGALPKPLYAHGSAVLGTVQQVAGAAGTALFVTVMTARVAALRAVNTAATTATAAGIREAFTYGAVISLFAIVASFFVRKPDET